jgi:hypothetical protein
MRLFFLWFLLGAFLETSAQVTNLVPNPSFEFSISCPASPGLIAICPPWFQTSPTITVDYYNICSPGQLGVPNNYNGFQYARTGFAYAGLVLLAFDNTPYREYLEVQLLTPLLSGKSYCVEFYVSQADLAINTCDSIAVYFSNDSLLNSNQTTIVCQNQIHNEIGNSLNDTANWVKVQGQFVAQGGENFMTIGNFNNFNPNAQIAYYYIDDVSVYECDDQVFVANAGENKIICSGDSIQLGSHSYQDYLYEWTPSEGLSLNTSGITYAYPSVTTTYYLHSKDFKFTESLDSVTVTVLDCIENNYVITPNADGQNDFFVLPNSMFSGFLTIYNRWGLSVYCKENYQNTWDAHDVSGGVYFFVITAQNGSYLKGVMYVIK